MPAQQEPPLGKFDRSVSLLTWAFNEEELVEAFLDRAVDMMERTVDEFEIVFVDDGSTDRTPEILAEYARKNPRLKVVTHEHNLNVGFACRSAVGAATKDYLFWQMVDWCYDISNLRVFLELTRHFDVVQGVRPTPTRLVTHIPVLRTVLGAKDRSDNLWKAVISLSNYYLIRILYGVPFHDYQNVTIYPRELVQSLDLVGESTFGNPEMLIKAYQKGATFIEVPIAFIPRQKGEAKGTKPGFVMRSVFDILKNWVKWGYDVRRSETRQITSFLTPSGLSDEVRTLLTPLLNDLSRGEPAPDSEPVF